MIIDDDDDKKLAIALDIACGMQVNQIRSNMMMKYLIDCCSIYIQEGKKEIIFLKIFDF